MTSRTRTATSSTLRALNAGAVLEVMRRTGPITVTEIKAATGLSRPTVHLVCEDLVRAGWVREADDDGAGPGADDGAGAGRGSPLGRPARRYTLNADAGYVVGVDMGVSTVTALVADLRGEVRGSAGRRLPRAGLDASARLGVVRGSIETALRAAGVEPAAVLAVGLGVPAPVSRDGRILASDSYLPGLAATDVADAVGATIRAPVLVENDANLAALAERWRGVATGVEDVLVLLAGERLGAGLVVDGRLLHGSRGGAGEMGFLTQVRGVGSADGIARLARDYLAEAGGEPASAEEVFAAARAGEPVACAVVDRVADTLARAIAPPAILLDPRLVVIGGAVAQACDVLLAPLERGLAALVPAPPRVVASTLGARAVVLGAVALALDHVERTLRPLPGVPAEAE